MTPRQHFLSLKTDKGRWEYLIQLDKSLFKIYLDNDATYVQFEESKHKWEYTYEDISGNTITDYEWEYKWDSFDGWIGWNDCAVALCSALGMNVVSV